jgi:hypothetical protein
MTDNPNEQDKKHRPPPKRDSNERKEMNTNISRSGSEPPIDYRRDDEKRRNRRK